MGGKLQADFRSGTRAEYMAIFGLSRIATVAAVPRQEDFGVVDLVCVLLDQRKDLLYPQGAFYVQVKANSNDIILKADDIAWITHNLNLPLFICVPDRKDGTLSFYSCSNLWQALFLRTLPSSITIKLGGDARQPDLHEDTNATTFDIATGPPILVQTLDELEADGALAYSILKTWIEADNANIARRIVGRLASQPTTSYTQYVYGPNYAQADRELAPILTALAHNYRHNGRREKLVALAAFLKTMVDFLDDHGRDFAEGRNTIP